MQLGLSSSDPVVLLAQRYPAQECEEACNSSPESKVSFMTQGKPNKVLLSCILTRQHRVQGEIERETERLELDFSGCLWFSYRAGFSPLGKSCSVNMMPLLVVNEVVAGACYTHCATVCTLTL